MRRRSVVSSVLGIAFPCLAALDLASPSTVSAQASGPQATRHPTICAAGVRTYTSPQGVPAVHDTLPLPPGPPIRVTSDEEAEAADLAMRGRAGSVGATGVLISEETENADGGMLVHRHVVALFVPSDTARARAACTT